MKCRKKPKQTLRQPAANNNVDPPCLLLEGTNFHVLICCNSCEFIKGPGLPVDLRVENLLLNLVVLTETQ